MNTIHSPEGTSLESSQTGMQITWDIPQLTITWTSVSDNFPNSIIIHTQEWGKNISYALRYSAAGEIKWNMFESDTDGSIKYTQQLHEIDIIKLWVQGIINRYEQAIKEKEIEQIESLKREILKNLYLQAEFYDPFVGSYPDTKILNPIKIALQELTIDEQKSLAEWFFEVTLGKFIGNNRGAYKVYYLFKWSPFAFRFSELEDVRLKKAWYAGFTL
jgi:hypothetical protein